MPEKSATVARPFRLGLERYRRPRVIGHLKSTIHVWSAPRLQCDGRRWLGIDCIHVYGLCVGVIEPLALMGMRAPQP